MMKKKLSKVSKFLNSDYKNIKRKTETITTVIVTPTSCETKTEKITTESSQNVIATITTISSLSILFLPLLSFFYLTFYLDVFGIAYDELSFNINDLTAILYQKGGFYLYISIVILFPLGVFFFSILYKNIAQTLKNKVIITIIFVIVFLFHVLLKETTSFTDRLIFSFDIFIVMIGVFFFYLRKSVSYIMLLGISVFLFTQLGVHDAKQREKSKPKFNIVIENENMSKTVLSEKESQRYFIRKTADFIFIMNEKDNIVESYPASDIKFMSFIREKTSK